MLASNRALGEAERRGGELADGLNSASAAGHLRKGVLSKKDQSWDR
jgi:hypothetical protein